MLSTFHNSEFICTGKKNYKTQEFIRKPKCIVEYNSSMGAIDKCDMVVSSIKSIRKSIKWYKKYFFHLLDIAVWNSYCLYKYKTRKNISVANYHLELIRQILQKYHKDDFRQGVSRFTLDLNILLDLLVDISRRFTLARIKNEKVD